MNQWGFGNMFRFSMVCVSLLLTSCEPPPSSPEPQTIRLAVARQPSSLLFFVALEKHLFEKYGLNVNLVFYPSGKRAISDGLVAGAADIAGALDAAVALAVFSHPELRVLASTVRIDDIGFIVARSDRGIQKPADLRGRVVATQSNSALHFFLHEFLLSNNVSDTEVKFKSEKLETLPELLASGQVDAISVREPYLSESLSLLKERATVFTASGVYEQTELLVTTDKLLNKSPALFYAVLSALLEAEISMPSKENVAEIVSRYVGGGVSLSGENAISFVARVELGQSLLSKLEEQARWGKANQLANGDIPNFLNILAPEPLDELAPERVTLIH
ncbi:MAG: ABC transporter substrate-binding protein [Gammaproteobacteria bacterium]